jgi:5-methylcytosine-specific restriction endonuclease McrA
MIGTCIFCSNQFKYSPSQKSGKYCSTKCQRNEDQRVYINEWLNGNIEGRIRGNYVSGYIRRYLLNESNYKCSQCGWSKINPHTGNVPLEIDHIDGDRTNSKRENLRVLCPNCHSLTSTYRALNIK